MALLIRKILYRFLWALVVVFGFYNQHEISLIRWGKDIFYKRWATTENIELAGFALVALIALFCLYWFLVELSRRNKVKVFFVTAIYAAMVAFSFILWDHFFPIRIKTSTVIFLTQMGVVIMLSYGMVAPFLDRKATGTVVTHDTGDHDHETADIPVET